MILKNKRTKEKLELSYNEFRVKFAKEIKIAFESFKKTELNKPYLKRQDDSLIEVDFYFDIRWNFNNFGNSAWYIEKL